MRSRLEAGFAGCDQVGLKWEYEPSAFASEDGQYLPDFVLRSVECSWKRDSQVVYVEVKPHVFWDDDDEVAKAARRMCVIAASEPDAELLIISPHEQPKECTGTDMIIVTEGPDDDYRTAAAEWVIGPGPPILGVLCRRPWSGDYWDGGTR